MTDPAESFVVARNPDPDSTLPYLLRVPIDGGALLKARDRWPTTARVYCHPLDQWPPDAEIVEQVAVRSCPRRGAAIDLVLDRGRNNRSQIVFTRPDPGRAGGRPMIFWQTARTAQRARPGQRVPTRRASQLEQLTIVIDTRERYPYKFAGAPFSANAQRCLPATTPSATSTRSSPSSSARRPKTSPSHLSMDR